MTNSILKNKQSTAKILGVSIISLFVMMTALSAVLFISPASIADDSEDLYTGIDISGLQVQTDPNPILDESCGIDIMLVLDSSGSMSSSDIADVKNAANSMVDALLPGTETRMGVVEFDWDVVSPTLGLNSDPTVIKDRINDISRGGNTNWADAIAEADSILGTGADSAKNDTLIVIITDGQPNEPGSNPLEQAIIAANTAKSHGTRIVAIGVHSDGNNGGYNLANLKAISGPNNATVPPDTITTETDVIDGDITELGNILYDLTTALCQECEHICLTPNPINDYTDETPSDNKLQDMLDDYNSETATIDVLNHQTQAQQLDIDDGVTRLSLEFEFVGKEAGHDNVFGYYFDEDVDNFTAIFETTDHWGYNAPIIQVGDTLTLNDIIVEGHDSISFAIDSNSSNGNYPYYMHNDLNFQEYDRALVFELCNEQDQYDKFVVCFEDLPDVNNPDGSDEDYEDVVTIVQILECPSCEEEPPEMVEIPDQTCVETAPSIQLNISDNADLNDIYYQIDSFDGNWMLLAENVSGPSYDESWTVPGFDALSEGYHTVYFMADDDCGNENGSDGSWNFTFQKDTLPPEVEVTFGNPNIVLPGEDGWTMIGAGTPVTLTATDDGSGVCTLWVSANGPTNLYPVYDGDPEDESEPGDGIIQVSFEFYEDCDHQIDYRAMDCCEHYNPSETGFNSVDFYVDATPPTTNTEIIGPSIPIPGGEYTWMGNCSTKVINTTDDGCQNGSGVDELRINIYISNSSNGPWEPIESYIIPDDGADQGLVDINPVEGEITVEYNFNESCWHIIEHYGVDLVGNEEIVDTNVGTKQVHKIDAEHPISWLETTMPMCFPDEQDTICVKTTTPIMIGMKNVGTEPCIYPEYWASFRVYVEAEDQWYPDETDGSGSYDIYGSDDLFEFDHDGDGTTEWYYIYDESFQFTEECNHTLEFFAKDPLCNTEEKHVYEVHVDDSEPTLSITPGLPICEKDDGSYCVNFSTMIALSAWEQGCCNNLSYVAYRNLFRMERTINHRRRSIL